MYVLKERRIEEALHQALIRAKKTVGLAESCTGGAIAARLTAMADASYYLHGSIVSYSNGWKETFLRVPATVLEGSGAVSRETVEAMMAGIFSQTEVDYAIAVSGIAGPSGGTAEKPVGTVYIGVGKRGERPDIGLVHAPQERSSAIDFTVQTALAALWRKVVHNRVSFS